MIRINLLGHEAEKKSAGSSLRVPELGVGATQAGISALVMLTLLGLVALWWSQTSTLEALRGDLASIQAQRAQLQEVADQVALVQERNALMRQKLDVIVDLKAKQTGPVMLLDQVSRRMTDGLWLTDLDLQGTRVSLRGAALSRTAVADFNTNLEDSRYFEDVRLRTLGGADGDAMNFQISLTFRSNPPGDAAPPAAVSAGGGS